MSSRLTWDFQKALVWMQVARPARLQSGSGDIWKDWTRLSSLLFLFVTCLPLQRLFVCPGSPPGRQGCEHHRLPGLQFKAIKNTKLRLECKPMARAPDSPAILTRPEVGAISEREEPVRELLVWVEVDTGGKLDRSRQSGHAGLHSKRKWCQHTVKYCIQELTIQCKIRLDTELQFMEFFTWGECRTGCQDPPSPTAKHSKQTLPSSWGKLQWKWMTEL